ncbi:MAG: hypothetical protein U1E65_19350 [Myxococcota bacterium]
MRRAILLLLLLAGCRQSGPSPELKSAQAALERITSETEDSTQSDERFTEAERLFRAVPASAPDYRVAQSIADELHQKIERHRRELAAEVAKKEAEAQAAAADAPAAAEESPAPAEVAGDPPPDLDPPLNPDEPPTVEDHPSASAEAIPTTEVRRAPAPAESAQHKMERERAARQAQESQAQCSTDYETCIGRCKQCTRFPPHMRAAQLCTRKPGGNEVCTTPPPEWSKDITQDVCCQGCYERRESCLGS